jgi:anti-sigma-K factor RskA
MMVKHISEEEISAWVDGQLGPGASGRVESHIRDCGDCRAAAKEMSALAEAFRATEIKELPPSIWSRVEANLESAVPARGRDLWSRFVPVIGHPVWMRATAAILAVVVLAVGGALFIEYRSAAEREKQALTEIQLSQNRLASLEAESYNPFRTAGAASSERNPFSRDQLRPDINPFRSAEGGR